MLRMRRCQKLAKPRRAISIEANPTRIHRPFYAKLHTRKCYSMEKRSCFEILMRKRYAVCLILYLLKIITSQTAILEEHLRSHGALVIDDDSQLPPAPRDGSPRTGYILIPHTNPDPNLPHNSADEHQPVLVTDMWVEGCLYRKRFEEPKARITNTPFRKFPIRGFETLAVCSTGFQGIDLVQMSKTVMLMGATYEEFFTPKASVLLCNAVVPGHEKLLHAHVWGVPAVKGEWLWDCVRKGEFLPFGSYLVQPFRDPNQMATPQDTSAKSRKGAKSLERSDMKSKRPNRKSLPSEKEKKRPINDTPSASERIQHVDPDPWSATTTKASHTNDSQLPDTNKTNDTTLTADNNADNSSSHTLRPTQGPLHEISPNPSQPKRSPSRDQSPEPSTSAEKKMPSPQKPDSTASSSLGPAISSLLAYHQRASSNSNSKPPAPPSEQQQQQSSRRRRQLLGRAPSNLSSHGINLSRASSVDTMNTDGLGTPLETCNVSKQPENTKDDNNNNTNTNTNT